MIEKLAVIMNGAPCAGKDTLCEMAAKRFRTRLVSSIDPIKEIASAHGWDGRKDEKSRKFLSELKAAFVGFNELPTQYLWRQYMQFLHGDEQILFVHIREPQEIDKFRKLIPSDCITLLITRDTVNSNWGNAADDNVSNYDYDYVFENRGSLREVEESFCSFLELLCNEKE